MSPSAGSDATLGWRDGRDLDGLKLNSSYATTLRLRRKSFSAPCRLVLNQPALLSN